MFLGTGGCVRLGVDVRNTEAVRSRTSRLPLTGGPNMTKSLTEPLLRRFENPSILFCDMKKPLLRKKTLNAVTGVVYYGRFYPAYLTGGDAKRFIEQKALKWCKGYGIDVGAGKWPLPGAIPVDKTRTEDAYHLDRFADESLDFVFSSHCLEHLRFWRSALALWVSKLKIGGILFLYVPHPDMKLWHPREPWVGTGHKWIVKPEKLLPFLKHLGLEIIETQTEPDDYYSWYVVARRVRRVPLPRKHGRTGGLPPAKGLREFVASWHRVTFIDVGQRGGKHMIRRLIDFLNFAVCWVKRRRIIRPKGAVVKVNVGSGLSVAPGWINIDASPVILFSRLPRFFLSIAYKLSGAKQAYSFEEFYSILKSNIFIHHDARYGLPLPSDSVDYIYSSHFLEHLSRRDAEVLLMEAHRVLKKGGIIRICVPDLEFVMHLYQRGSREKALAYFFTKPDLGRLSQHRYMYDFCLLKNLLTRTGFTDVKRCSYGQGRVPDIAFLDNRPEETLYVEAVK